MIAPHGGGATALYASRPARGREETTCRGCGLVLPARPGPEHAFVGASAACWERYGRLSRAMAFEHRSPSRMRRLIEDAYAVQHPGVRQRRSVQSVAIHLMGLCVLLERDGEQRRIAPVLGRTPPGRRLVLRWLEPPQPNGTLTIADALDGDIGDDLRSELVETWASNVWDAWAEHHATVRGWLGSAA